MVRPGRDMSLRMPGEEPVVSHLAGIPIQGAVPNLVGQLIVKQTQLDLVMDQIRTIHRPENSVVCGCGLTRERCRTWPIIAAYDKARKQAEQ